MGNPSERETYIREVINDYKTCVISREVSLLGRKEVLTGKAKFGIFGDGKEVPQVAMARAFKKGDFRAGYYRDQTFMFALGLATVEDFFAQLYADANHDPFSGGRQMITHFATPLIDESGNWTNHKNQYNITSDISCTAGQMARAVGLALASKKYKELEGLIGKNQFSNGGNEACFVTIGDGSTSEGAFWEAINAAGVMKIPLVISIWDDGYAISVPSKYQTTKQDISAVLAGFKKEEKTGEGIELYKIKGWNYPALRELYQSALAKTRKTHTPCIIHVDELTQPQGHSSSGSHERYKSKERLEWERTRDGIVIMRKWILDSRIATEEQLEIIEYEAKKYVLECKKRAWEAYTNPIKKEIQKLSDLYDRLILTSKNNKGRIHAAKVELTQLIHPGMADLVQNFRRLAPFLRNNKTIELQNLKKWLKTQNQLATQRYHTKLYSDSKFSALKVPPVPAQYSAESKLLNGYQILNKFFDIKLKTDKRILAFGEDLGKIGDVNQGFAGLQEKYGEERVFDTGIREWTIMGQAIGLAMRGFRPIAEIQYLDYLVYGLTPLADDLATLRYRSNGIQQAPAIIRSRGHRLEGIWHSGSPMTMLLGSLQGIYILVPRNMVQAAGFYNTMLQSDDPALIIECLNGYRLKERLPDNLNEFSLPLGIPEILQEGRDITLVTYGSCVRVAQEGIKLLEAFGVSVELIDVQTLLPFDLNHSILESLKKTNRIVFLDEDIPGGATSYMMQQVLELQQGYQYLDAQPKTITASNHRTPYGTDGDYFSKPNPEDVFDVLYELMHEANPKMYPAL
ncbi:MAG TPA: transketolase [Saprospiraceae bacterium]|nr:transketolase [Saprospiraceae bacterium]